MFSAPAMIIIVAANAIHPVQPVRFSYATSVIWQPLLGW